MNPVDNLPSVAHLLPESEWHKRALSHATRVDQWTAGRLERAARGSKHPVDDFLFEYYPTRPRQLRRWHPGLGIALANADYLANDPAYIEIELDGTRARTVNVARFEHRRTGLAWVEGLVRRSSERTPRTNCFGLHEWAMVYGLGQDQVRHDSWPLRLEPSQIRTTVDDVGLRCTHYDAFRFFTAEAAAKNDTMPTRESQPELDQPGCLHATMDLYKWSMKYVSLVGSDLVADCFELAREGRALDMRAAPYDLRDLGYEPICVESASGRAEYVRRQRNLMDDAAPLRARLAAALSRVLGAIDALPTSLVETPG